VVLIAAWCSLLLSSCATPGRAPSLDGRLAGCPRAGGGPVAEFTTPVQTAESPYAQPPAAAQPIPAPAVVPIAFEAPIPAASPPQEPFASYTVAEALQFALDHHPILRVRQHEVEIARAKLVAAGLLPNPDLVVDLATPDDATGGASRLSTRLMFTVPIGPKRELRTDVAAYGVQASRWALSSETKRVLADVVDAATEVMYLRELAVVDGQVAEMAGKIVEIQKERFNAAAVPYRNVVLVELAAGKAELAQRNTMAQLSQARVRLARAIAANDGALPDMRGSLAVEPVAFPPLADVLARARRCSPELAQADDVIRESRQQAALEWWNAVPDVSIGPRVWTDLGDSGQDRIGGRLDMHLPVFNQNQGPIAESEAQWQKSCANHKLIEITTLNDVASLYLELQDAQSQADYYRKQVRPLIARTEAALREAFQDRAVAAYELTDLLESMARMELGELEIRYTHQRLRARLEILLEGSFPPVGKAGAAIPAAPSAALLPPEVAPAT